MAHKCFISFKKEDQYYRNKLDSLFDDEDVINKSLDRVIDSENGKYIMQVIRDDYLKDSTVTIFFFYYILLKMKAQIGMAIKIIL